MKTKNLFRILALALFLPGIIIGMLLFGVAAWADLEATFYGFEGIGGEPLQTLECPILMTTSEVSTVSATFKNPNDKPIDMTVCGDFSNPGLIRNECLTLSLDANQTKKASFEVSSNDIDLNNFIFAQISNYFAPKIHSHQATCGIMVLDWPQFTGKQIFTFAMIVVIMGIVGGLVLWETYGRPFTGKLPEITRAMRTLAIIVLVGMLVSFLGYWLFGILIFAIAVLAIGVMLGFSLAE